MFNRLEPHPLEKVGNLFKGGINFTDAVIPSPSLWMASKIPANSACFRKLFTLSETSSVKRKGNVMTRYVLRFMRPQVSTDFLRNLKHAFPSILPFFHSLYPCIMTSLLRHDTPLHAPARFRLTVVRGPRIRVEPSDNGCGSGTPMVGPLDLVHRPLR